MHYCIICNQCCALFVFCVGIAFSFFLFHCGSVSCVGGFPRTSDVKAIICLGVYLHKVWEALPFFSLPVPVNWSYAISWAEPMTQSTQNFSSWMCLKGRMKERERGREWCRERQGRVKCEHVLLAWLPNSGSALEVIDSLEAVSTAGKS